VSDDVLLYNLFIHKTSLVSSYRDLFRINSSLGFPIEEIYFSTWRNSRVSVLVACINSLHE
jgi:hypothetical protein